MQTLKILGTNVHDCALDEAADLLVHRAMAPRPTRVSFLNAHNSNVAADDDWYRRTLETSDLTFADGTGVRWAASWAGHRLRDNVNGTDLFPRLLARMQRFRQSVYLLGGAPGVAGDVAAYVRENFPGVRVVGVDHGYHPPEHHDVVVAGIRRVQPDFLLVAMGTPVQETWLARHLPETGARVGMAVGGLFDFYAARVRRAPAAVRAVGVEWAYRLWQEPRRLWRRYLVGNPRFLMRVVREGRAA